MLRSLLIGSAIAAALAAPALAQSAPETYDWTGPYVGVNLGYGGGDFRYPFSGTADIAGKNPVAGGLRQSSSGVLGGGQIGYNFEMPNGIVLGAETDLGASRIQGRSSYSSLDSLGDATSDALRSRIDYLGTVRARVGEAMFGGRFVPYLTGGFAYGGVRTDAATSPGSSFESARSTQTGWTAGAGADYALTRHLSFRAEYLYVDLGRTALASDATRFSVPGADIYGASVQERANANVMRVGVNYKF
ncbi:MAG TPA: outer membrane beta-barrel protein [Caulobacteraceae bacterium]|nr:outer membrane beta-barrel protein [Caulobacteraceae bacterium]